MDTRLLLRGDSCGGRRLARRSRFRVRSQASVLALAVLAAMLVVAPSAGAGVLDQSQPTLGDNSTPVASEMVLAQTFTAGITGGLDQVDLAVFRVRSGLTVPLIVEIRASSSGLPAGPPLTSASVSAASVPGLGSATFVSIPFASPAAVAAGVRYAIVLSSPCGHAHCYRWIHGTGVDPYPGGSALLDPPWRPLPLPDFAFKTYVAAAAVRPTSKQQCKKGGWRRFTNPSFKNQGQCVAYVNHHDGKGKDDEKSHGKTKGGKKK